MILKLVNKFLWLNWRFQLLILKIEIETKPLIEIVLLVHKKSKCAFNSIIFFTWNIILQCYFIDFIEDIVHYDVSNKIKYNYLF